MSVSSAPATSAINPTTAAAGGAAGTGGTAGAAVVVQVLAAYGGDSVRNGLVQTLQSSAGPGNLLSGTITDIRGDGTFTLQTKAGVDLTLQRPPDVPLSVGSAVTLRLVATTPQPQVAILTVDGKVVSAPATATSAPPQFAAPAGSTLPLINPQPAALAGLPPATLASTLFATISLEDEVAIESALSGDTAVAASTADAPLQAEADSVVATLVRPAPPRVGGTPIATGTRYLATLSVGNADSDPAAPAARTVSTTPATPDEAGDPVEPAAASAAPDAADPAAQPPPATGQAAPAPAPLDLSNFKALATVLAGRVLATSTDTETLVDTAVGTLSIPVQETPPPIGASIQLKIIAVAPPITAEKPAAAPPPVSDNATPAPLLEEAAAALAPVAPALAQQLQAQLSLPPNDQLTSLILSFLGGLKAAGPTPARWPDPAVRKVLVETGHSDVAAKLDADASQIGRQRPAPPGDWSITVLPYLGSATSKPMRLYRRTPDAEEQQRGGGERFVVELEMVRLGALQFDGLVRERRFDLVLRSEKPLEDGLKQGIERTFRDSLLIAGWSGELSYARSGPVPMIPLPPEGSGVGLDA
jgi:hypothetical protein